MSRTNWKGFERDIARAIGVERYSKTSLGEKAPDVLKEIGGYRLVIECKNKKYINVNKEVKDAEKYRMSGKDILALCYRKTNSSKTDVFMKLKDFRKLHAWLKKLIDEKSYLQVQEIVVKLDLRDFLWMENYGSNFISKRNKKKINNKKDL